MPSELTSNRILASLSSSSLKRLRAHLELEEGPLKRVLYNADEPIEHVFFPLSGVVSLVKDLKDGSIIEVATVGNEGFIGLPVLLGAVSMPCRAIQQVPGRSARVATQAFRERLERDPDLEALLRRYTQALFNQVAQTAACNRGHALIPRCARWLLMTHDRAGSDEFEITQEFLAQMLGVRRAGVNEAEGALRKEKCIEFSRGRMKIVNRAKLEKRSCECYRLIASEYDRLLPPAPSS